jgi:hypothetical protein
MKRFSLFVLLLCASLLFLNLLTGCQSIPKNGYKPQPKNGAIESQVETPNSPSVTAISASGSGSLPQSKIFEVKHFTQTDGLGLSQDFVNSFYDGLCEHLIKAGVADQIVDEGSTVPDVAAANVVVIEGKFNEYKEGGFLAGIVGSEIKLYRKNDHTLITTIPAKVPYKPSPFNTDKLIGKATGGRTAYEIKKALK